MTEPTPIGAVPRGSTRGSEVDMPRGSTRGKARVKAALDNATLIKPGAPTEPPGDSEQGNAAGLPEGCVVEPLGKQGDTCYYLDAIRQLCALKARDHGRLNIMGMFGQHPEQLYNFWPRKKFIDDENKWVTTGWKPEEAAEILMSRCADIGVWDPFTRLRGAGAWAGEQGELILHCGDTILINGVAHRPGPIGAHVYPAGVALPRPDFALDKDQVQGQLERLQALLGTWRWKRPELDVRLLIGWLAAAVLGGALNWRPLIWITGDLGTGKSKLHEAIKLTLGDMLLSVVETTAAGIWQKLGYSALPVAIDELEAEADDRRAQNVIKLARQAASGGVILRGGADHQGAEFTARACFLFSSILVPPLMAQDRSRLAILELEPFPAMSEPPLINRALCRDFGRALVTALARRWTRFPRTLDYYRRELGALGFDGRGADQFGTLLACGDLATIPGTEPPDASSAGAWLDEMKAIAAERAGEHVRDHDRCLQHLLTSPLDTGQRGAVRRTVMAWLREAFKQPNLINNEVDESDADKVLGSFGLRVFAAPVEPEEPAKGMASFLAVATNHQGLDILFQGKHWAGRSGADAVWTQALRRLPGARRHGAIRFQGVAIRCTLVPMSVIEGREAMAGAG